MCILWKSTFPNRSLGLVLTTLDFLLSKGVDSLCELLSLYLASLKFVYYYLESPSKQKGRYPFSLYPSVFRIKEWKSKGDITHRLSWMVTCA